MTISTQFLHLVFLILSGIVVAAVIDCVRIIKIEAPKRSLLRQWAIPLELGIWVILGIGTYMLLFMISKGQWRAIDPLAQISGILLYQTIFQRPVRFIGRLIWYLLLRPIWLLLIGMTNLILWFIRLIMMTLIFFVNPIFKICKKIFHTLFKKRR